MPGAVRDAFDAELSAARTASTPDAGGEHRTIVGRADDANAGPGRPRGSPRLDTILTVNPGSVGDIRPLVRSERRRDGYWCTSVTLESA